MFSNKSTKKLLYVDTLGGSTMQFQAIAAHTSVLRASLQSIENRSGEGWIGISTFLENKRLNSWSCVFHKGDTRD
jgi:hypothetical protein